MNYLIDTSVWAEYFDGTERGKRILSIIEEEALGTSIMAIAELADKFERQGRPFLSTFEFIRGRAVVLPVTISVVLSAAKIKKKIRAEKTKFGLVDAIHLATAQEEGLLLVTFDRDFSGVEGVMLVK